MMSSSVMLKKTHYPVTVCCEQTPKVTTLSGENCHTINFGHVKEERKFRKIFDSEFRIVWDI